MRNKENAFRDWLIMIVQCWTWKRMTVMEQADCIYAVTCEKISGSYDNRWGVLHKRYQQYLKSIGYTGAGWRE